MIKYISSVAVHTHSKRLVVYTFILYRVAEMRKKTQEEFEQDVALVNPEIQILGEYINNATNIKVKCTKCGRQWEAVPTKITVRYNCPLCEKQKEFTTFLSKNDLVGLDPYQDNFTRINVQCKKCGKCWNAIPKVLKRDPRCPNCSNKGHYKKWSHENFEEEIRKRAPNIRIKQEYVGYEEKIKCQCKKCGYEFSQSAHQLLAGRGCPKCNGHHTWTVEEFEQQVFSVNPNIEATGFTGIRKRVHCRCRICGYEWNPVADSVIRGSGCSRCSGHERLDFKRFKTDYEFSHPTIEILDTDVRTTTEMIKCRCKRCDNMSMMMKKK